MTIVLADLDSPPQQWDEQSYATQQTFPLFTARNASKTAHVEARQGHSAILVLGVWEEEMVLVIENGLARQISDQGRMVEVRDELFTTQNF